ncbi:MAG TPA: cupin domain-containing protein [Solirubrobacteraceae bacterium]|nr:cupin domain-containing protein [Solirubrobacteraceae bacterium]
MTDAHDLVAAHGVDAATVALELIGPKPGAFAGAPVESAITIHEDERLEIGVWACTPGSFPSFKDGISEVMQFVAGEATIVGEDGALHEIGPGALLFTPDGWRGTWHVRQTVRKAFVIWRTG